MVGSYTKFTTLSPTNILHPKSKATMGSVKLIFTKLIKFVSLEQFHHKASGICDGGSFAPQGQLNQ